MSPTEAVYFLFSNMSRLVNHQSCLSLWVKNTTNTPRQQQYP